MPILANNGDVEREFSCEQIALMGGSLPPGWNIVKNTCGKYVYNISSPYANYGLDITGNVITGNWYFYEANILLNKIEVPIGTLVLPSDPRNVRVVIRRQVYHPTEPGATRDFNVNTLQNRIEFTPGRFPSLNGQRAIIEVFK